MDDCMVGVYSLTWSTGPIEAPLIGPNRNFHGCPYRQPSGLYKSHYRRGDEKLNFYSAKGFFFLSPFLSLLVAVFSTNSGSIGLSAT